MFFYHKLTFSNPSPHHLSAISGSHAVWQAGRKVKDTNFPFVPTSADLPDHDGKVCNCE